MRVSLTDLPALHAPIRAELDAAIARVVDGGRFILGDEVDAFERALAARCDVPHAIGTSSGSDAILAILWAIGVRAGDEVITPAFSFIAAAEAIARLGAKPVFADVGDDGNLDAASALSRVTKSTRAILPVDLFGRRADVGSLASAGVPIVEDAAQAIGARGIGRGVHAAAISFFPTKNLGALGDGGAIITERKGIADAARKLRAHGASASEKYVYERVGWNMRLDALQAAVLGVKLAHLDAWTNARRRIAARYRAELASVPFITLPEDDPDHVWHQFVIRSPRRDALRAHLAAREIQTEIYYPRALHLQPSFADLGGRAGDFPNAERAAAESLAIPIHPSLGDAELAHVIASIEDREA